MIINIVVFILKDENLLVVLDDGEIVLLYNILRNFMMDFLECFEIDVEGVLRKKMLLYVKIIIENENILCIW